MSNVIHTAHNSIDDSRAFLALQAEPRTGPHRDEFTEVCSEIRRGETGGSVVRRRWLGPRRAWETKLMKDIGSDKDGGFFQGKVPRR